MERLTSFIEEQLAAWEMPGCAVVAVKDAEIVLNQGFGLRDLGAQLPVTAQTLFAIGSTTKGFTCTTP
jgi:CubicO group peptidase (beta-lactamase class C family)